MIALEQALPEDMTDEQWHTRGQPIRVLLSDLMEVGLVAGAVLPYAQEQGDGRIEFGRMQNPDFDWQHGEIDMQGTRWGGEFDRAKGLIARLVKMTGITE